MKIHIRYGSARVAKIHRREGNEVNKAICSNRSISPVYLVNEDAENRITCLHCKRRLGL